MPQTHGAGYDALPTNGNALPPVVLDPAGSREILPDCVRTRNACVAEMFAAVIPEAHQAVVPHKPTTTEDLYAQLADVGVDPMSAWVYGSHLPEHLFPRATKAQVHLPAPGDTPPKWYDYAFPNHVKDTTVPGYACFSRQGMRAAAGALLGEFKQMRFKDPSSASGEGQIVVSTLDELDNVLDYLEGEIRAGQGMGLDKYLSHYGFVAEANLLDVQAWSFTVTSTPNQTYSSFGRIIETRVALPDGREMQEYGGTSTVVVRGDPKELAHLPNGGIRVEDPVLTNEDIRLCPHPAIINAAQRHVEGMRLWERDGVIKTRANVDILTGRLVRRDGTEQWVAASVEDSGRVGGASAAELSAIKALQDDTSLPYAVRSTRHSFDTSQAMQYAAATAQVPHGRIFWHGEDPTWGGKFVFMGVF